MTIEEMKKRKKELGYSNAKIAELSGVPFSTVQKIFSGVTDSPRYETLRMLESIFQESEYSYETNSDGETVDRIGEEAQTYHVHGPGEYTIEDYYALPEDQRVELIDGYFYDMTAPSLNHQEIAGEIYRQISNFIIDHNGDCRPFISPIDVQLDCDNKTMVQPDVAILCDKNKNIFKCVYGAPDFVLEVISKSTRKKDYTKKMYKYMNAGVREYWILDPYKRSLVIFEFEKEECPVICGLDKPMPIGIYGGDLMIDFTRINQMIDMYDEIRSRQK